MNWKNAIEETGWNGAAGCFYFDIFDTFALAVPIVCRLFHGSMCLACKNIFGCDCQVFWLSYSSALESCEATNLWLPSLLCRAEVLGGPHLRGPLGRAQSLKIHAKVGMIGMAIPMVKGLMTRNQSRSNQFLRMGLRSTLTTTTTSTMTSSTSIPSAIMRAVASAPPSATPIAIRIFTSITIIITTNEVLLHLSQKQSLWRHWNTKQLWQVKAQQKWEPQILPLQIVPLRTDASAGRIVHRKRVISRWIVRSQAVLLALYTNSLAFT